MLVTEEITRRIAAQELATSANLRDAVAAAPQDSGQQFLIEKESISQNSVAFEARITNGILGQVDERLGVITAQVPSQFVAENEAMRAEILILKGVMEPSAASASRRSLRSWWLLTPPSRAT